MERVAMHIIIGLLIFSISMLLVKGNICPNDCSGHGQCNARWLKSRCACFDGWTAPDCSQRSCPYDIAWADKAYEMDLAHKTAECSNNGLCNRQTGKCDCFDGFEGQACQKSSCPKKCSGHGVCTTMSDLYNFYTQNKSAYPYYTGWEANHTTACACDIGYSGGACEIRVCPRGVDPLLLQYNKGYPTFILTTHAINVLTGYTYGTFRISFQEESIYLPSNKTLTDKECKAKFESLPNVGKVDCVVSTSGHYTKHYNVTFLSAPTTVYENNIYSNNGTYFVKSFACDGGNVIGTTATCEIQDFTPYSRNLPRYEYCSNRGICQLSTGTCKCYRGFSNINCDIYTPPKGKQSVYVNDVLNAIVDFDTTDKNYTGNVLNLGTMYTGAADGFCYINVSNIDDTLLTINGKGDLNTSSLMQSALGGTGGLTITLGGLYVGSGGFTINSGGLIVTGGLTLSGDVNRLEAIAVRASGVSVTGGLTLYDNGLAITTGGLTVNNLGVGITTGGLTVTAGGTTIGAGGLMVFTSGVKVKAGGLRSKKGITLQNSGLIVSGGLTINSIYVGYGHATSLTGITINSAGLTITGGLTVYDAGLVLENAMLSLPNDDLRINSGLTLSTSGLVVTGGVTVSDNGLSITGGLSLTSLGLKIPIDGLQVTGGITLSNSLNVIGGVTLLDNGLVVTSGITVKSGGIYSAADVTVQNNGMICSSCNMYVQSNSLQALGSLTVYGSLGVVATAGGVSVGTIGTVITGGLTVQNQGLMITGGVTIADSGGLKGLSVTGGVTIRAGGLYTSDKLQLVGNTGIRLGPAASSGAAITNSGLMVTGGVTLGGGTGLNVVSGGLTVYTGGMKVTGGVTLKSVGVNVVAGGMTVSASGVKIISGNLNLYNSGGSIRVASGITIPSGGLLVSGGVTVTDVGLIVTGGISVNSEQVRVKSGGVFVAGNGMVMQNGRFASYEGTTITQGGLSVTTNGLMVTNGLTVIGGLATYLGGVTIGSAGLAVTGGVTTTVFGINVIQGGATVLADGVTLTGGMSIRDVGLAITGATVLSINRGGVYVQNTGVTINDGLLVLASGMSVASSGIYVTGGMTLKNSGLVTHTLTDYDGLYITGGITTNKLLTAPAVSTGLYVMTGMAVSGGVTILDSGVNLPVGTLTCYTGLAAQSATINDGLAVTGGVSIKSGGLNVALGGLTVNARLNRGLIVQSGAVSVASGGMTVQQTGTTVYSGGVAVSGGLTVTGITFLESSPVIYSDMRLKQNIQVLQNPLKKVKKLRGVYFNWLSSSLTDSETVKKNSTNTKNQKALMDGVLMDDRRHLGLLAQDVLEIFPEIVTTMKGSKYLGVNYKEVVPLLIEAIREIDQITAEILNKLIAKNARQRV